MSEKPSEISEMSEVMWVSERLQDAWYADERISLKPRELRRVEQLTGKHYAARDELRNVEQLISNAEALMDGTDPDFSRAFVTAIRALAGLADRTGDR